MDSVAFVSRRLLPGFLLVVSLACRSEPLGEPLGQEGAHEHGVADVSMVAEGREATVLFRAPAGDLFGSEGGEPTAEERELARAALDRLEANLPAMLGLPADLECRVAEVVWSGAAEEMWEHGAAEGDGEEHGAEHGEDAGHDHEDHANPGSGGEAGSESAEGEDEHDEGDHDHGDEEHSDVVADFRLACAEPLEGVTLRLAFAEHFEAIEKIDLQAVSRDRQVGRRVAASGVEVQL